MKKFLCLVLAICGLVGCTEDPARPPVETSVGEFAIESVEDAVAEQAGIVARGGELYVRCCRSGEVSFRIDNVEVSADTPNEGSARAGN